MFELAGDAALDRAGSRRVHPDDRERPLRPGRTACDSGRDFEHEFRLLLPAG